MDLGRRELHGIRSAGESKKNGTRDHFWEVFLISDHIKSESEIEDIGDAGGESMVSRESTGTGGGRFAMSSSIT